MKNHFTTLMAFGVALSMMASPFAMAEDQHDGGAHDQHPALQHSTMQHDTMQHSTMQHSSMQHSSMQQMSPQHMSPQHGAGQHQYVQHQVIQTQPREAQESGHHWRHGQHYDGSRRVVSNWQQYHLHQPPHGYEWVQDGSQFVLIAVASGIIADVIANALSR